MKRALPVIYCTKCEEKIILTSEDREKSFITCSKCNDTTTFSSDMIKYHLIEREPAEIPSDMVLEQNGRDLVMIWKWKNLYGYIGFFAGLLPLFASLSFYYSMKDKVDVFSFIIFMIFFVCIFSFILIYTGLSRIFNRTIIRVNDDFITVHTEPFPFSGPVKITVSEVEQLFCYEEKDHHVSGNSKKRYTLKALLKNGRVESLYSNFDPSPERALFIEEEIENFLDIKDLPVTTGYKL